MEMETRRKSGHRGLNGGPYRAVTVKIRKVPHLSPNPEQRSRILARRGPVFAPNQPHSAQSPPFPVISPALGLKCRKTIDRCTARPHMTGL